MSIFGRFSYSYNIPVVEGYGVEVNGDILAIQESYDDQLAIIEAMYEIDMTEIEYRSQGQENSAVCEATIKDKAKNAWEKIKKFFQKLWAKLKAFFESMKRFVNGLFMSGYKFAQKYKSQLEKLKLSGFKYEMFEYTNLDEDVSTKYDATKSASEDRVTNCINQIKKNIDDKDRIDQYTKNVKDYREENSNKRRGLILGKSPLTSEEYKEELYKYFRGDKTVKTMQSVNINEVIKALLNKSQTETVEKMTKKIDNDFKEILSKLDEVKKLVEGKSNDISTSALNATSSCTSVETETKDIILSFIRAWKDALVERSNVYKKVCITAFRHKEDK